MSAVFLNDRLVTADQAVVSVSDRGFTSGDGVFETLKVIKGQPFALTRHLQRLDNSLRIVGLPAFDPDFLRSAINETLAANSLAEVARLRITVSAGQPTPGLLIRGDGPVTLVITVTSQAAHPAAVAIVSTPWPHNERGPLVGAKTTSYADNLAILERARAQGADEALMYDTQGRLCEATTANLLVEADGVLCTPTLATGCLPGVTRSLALEWGLCVERDLFAEDVLRAGEALVCSSTRDLIPIRMIDGRALAAPGPLGAFAVTEFARRSALNLDP